MTEENFHNPSEEKEFREMLRLSLQILPSGFSADYLNYFSSLQASLKLRNYDFKLPTYWKYVENKLRDFYPNPDDSVWEVLELSDMYYQWLTDVSLESFNEGISEINTLIASRAGREDIKAKVDAFTEKFLNNKYMWENPKRFLDILNRMKEQGM